MNNKETSSFTSISDIISRNHVAIHPTQVLPEINIDHVIALTDDTGIFQHAVFSIPDYREGYTTDDNARAVLLSVMLESVPGETPLQINKYAPRYLGMLWY